MEHRQKSNNQDLIGKVFTIKFCQGAEKSLIQAIARVSPTQKKDKLYAKIFVLLKRISNSERLAQGEVVSEGSLPNKKKFKALKKIPIRCYFWYSDKHSKVIFVSHFIYKDFDSLSQRDVNKVVSNWKEMEH